MYRCLAPSRRSIPFDVDSRAAISIGEIRMAVTSIFRPKWLRFLVLLHRGCWLSATASDGAAAGETVSVVSRMSGSSSPSSGRRTSARIPHCRTIFKRPLGGECRKNSDDRDLDRSASSRHYFSQKTLNSLLFKTEQQGPGRIVNQIFHNSALDSGPKIGLNFSNKIVMLVRPLCIFVRYATLPAP